MNDIDVFKLLDESIVASNERINSVEQVLDAWYIGVWWRGGRVNTKYLKERLKREYWPWGRPDWLAGSVSLNSNCSSYSGILNDELAKRNILDLFFVTNQAN